MAAHGGVSMLCGRLADVTCGARIGSSQLNFHDDVQLQKKTRVQKKQVHGRFRESDRDAAMRHASR